MRGSCFGIQSHPLCRWGEILTWDKPLVEFSLNAVGFSFGTTTSQTRPFVATFRLACGQTDVTENTTAPKTIKVFLAIVQSSNVGSVDEPFWRSPNGTYFRLHPPTGRIGRAGGRGEGKDRSITCCFGQSIDPHRAREPDSKRESKVSAIGR